MKIISLLRIKKEATRVLYFFLHLSLSIASSVRLISGFDLLNYELILLQQTQIFVRMSTIMLLPMEFYAADHL